MMNCMIDDQLVLFQMIDWPNEAQVRYSEWEGSGRGNWITLQKVMDW